MGAYYLADGFAAAPSVFTSLTRQVVSKLPARVSPTVTPPPAVNPAITAPRPSSSVPTIFQLPRTFSPTTPTGPSVVTRAVSELEAQLAREHAAGAVVPAAAQALQPATPSPAVLTPAPALDLTQPAADVTAPTPGADVTAPAPAPAQASLAPGGGMLWLLLAGLVLAAVAGKGGR